MKLFIKDFIFFSKLNIMKNEFVKSKTPKLFHSEDNLYSKMIRNQQLNYFKRNKGNNNDKKMKNTLGEYKESQINTQKSNNIENLYTKGNKQILITNFSEADRTTSSQSIYSNINNKTHLTDYQITFSNRKKNVNSNPIKISFEPFQIKYKPVIKVDNDSYCGYVNYDRKKVFEVRNKFHHYLTLQLHNKLNSIDTLKSINSHSNVESSDGNFNNCNNIQIRDYNDKIYGKRNLHCSERKEDINDFNKINSNVNNRSQKIFNINNNDVKERSCDLEKFINFTNKVLGTISVKNNKNNTEENNKNNLNEISVKGKKLNLKKSAPKSIDYEKLKFNHKKVKNQIQKTISSLNNNININNKYKNKINDVMLDNKDDKKLILFDNNEDKDIILLENKLDNDVGNKKDNSNEFINRKNRVKKLTFRTNENYNLNLNKNAKEYIEEKLKQIKTKMDN